MGDPNINESLKWHKKATLNDDPRHRVICHSGGSEKQRKMPIEADRATCG